MAAYRKKPVTIEARRFLGDDDVLVDVAQWCGGKINWSTSQSQGAGTTVSIETLEGTMAASMGDYVIRGVQGEFYPCKPDIFQATYEALAPAE